MDVQIAVRCLGLGVLNIACFRGGWWFAGGFVDKFCGLWFYCLGLVFVVLVGLLGFAIVWL